MKTWARAVLAVALGLAGVPLFVGLTVWLVSVAPRWLDAALNEVGLGDEGFGSLALLMLGAASGVQVGLMAGWFLPDAHRLGRTYAGLVVGALGLSLILLTGVFHIGALTNEGGTDLRGYLGFSCLPVAVAGYYFLIRHTLARSRAREAQAVGD